MTGIVGDEVYTHLECQNVILVKQKGCGKNTHGTKDKLLIDKLLLLDSMAKHKNLELLWIDFKKVYDSVLHSWIWKCLQMFKISNNVVFLLHQAMKTCWMHLWCGSEHLGSVKIKTVWYIPG